MEKAEIVHLFVTFYWHEENRDHVSKSIKANNNNYLFKYIRSANSAKVPVGSLGNKRMKELLEEDRGAVEKCNSSPQVSLKKMWGSYAAFRKNVRRTESSRGDERRFNRHSLASHLVCIMKAPVTWT